MSKVVNLPTAFSQTSTLNSTTTALASGGTYTGTADQSDLPHVGVMVKTDQPGTLYFDFSGDGTNWDSTFPVSGFAVAASVSEFHTGVKLGRYFRVRFVNDNDGDQTYLRLFTYFGSHFVPSNAPLNQSIGLDTDATSVRPTNFDDEVVIGRRTGVSHFTKFAYREGLTAANGEEQIWNTTGNFTPLTTASTFTITYTNTQDGSTANGAKTLYFVYVDANGERATAVHTLGSSGSDQTSFSGLGINRVAVSSSGSTQTNGAAIAITATTGGTTQAHIAAGEGVTQQAIYHTPSNADAVGKLLWAKVNKTSGGAAPKVLIKGYAFNRAVQTRFLVFRATIDTQSDTTINIVEPVGFGLSPSDVLYFVADTDQNSTVIDIRFSVREYTRL